MGESMKSRIRRMGFNLFPAFRRSGGRITYLSGDWREVSIRLPLNWKTRNYVGTIYGGSMYAAVDGIYMVMLINLLGPDYVVWDRSASVEYLKPGRNTLYARFHVDEEELLTIKGALEKQSALERSYRIEWKDGDANVCAIITKRLYFRKKRSSTR